MSAAVPTTYTDQIEYSEEIAEFSPEIIEEMNRHLAKYPPDRKRSALIPILLLVIQRNADGSIIRRELLAKLLDLEVTDIWETATFTRCLTCVPSAAPYPDLQNLSCKIMGEPI